MITLYYDINGTLLVPAYLNGQSAFGPDTGSHTSAVGTVTFDETTNPALVTGLGTKWEIYTAPAGVLTYSGQPVSVNPPSVATTQAQQVQSQAQQVIDDITTYLALGSPTNAQTVAAFREVAQVVRYLLRTVILHGL